MFYTLIYTIPSGSSKNYIIISLQHGAKDLSLNCVEQLERPDLSIRTRKFPIQIDVERARNCWWFGESPWALLARNLFFVIGIDLNAGLPRFP